MLEVFDKDEKAGRYYVSNVQCRIALKFKTKSTDFDFSQIEPALIGYFAEQNCKIGKRQQFRLNRKGVSLVALRIEASEGLLILWVRYPPSLAISTIVYVLKSSLTKRLRSRSRGSRGKSKTMWYRGYEVVSIDPLRDASTMLQ